MAKGNIFQQVKMAMVPSSTFNLSHTHTMSMQMGRLYPGFVLETIPGDKFEIEVENMLRMAPLVSPVMHRITVDTHVFFVPKRILWPNWEKWITDDLEVAPPHTTFMDDLGDTDLGTYLGYGRTDSSQTKQLAFRAAAYLAICQEFYRDQNLHTELEYELVDGENGTKDVDGTLNLAQYLKNSPLRRSWQHDYFTSCLPFAQKGDAVTLPLTSATAADVTLKSSPGQPLVKDTTNLTLEGTADLGTDGSGTLTNTNTNNPVVVDPNGSLEVDINAEASTINTLRRAFRLQEWLEKNARGGTRYIESILSHFGVRSSDSRMHRPEYVGGTKQNMVISEVLATAESTGVAIGEMAGHGISVGGGNKMYYKCEEHGILMSIISIRPDTAYLSPLHRNLLKFDNVDFAWPSFASIGEQEVTKIELNSDVTDANKDDVFGYIPRYSEYKFEHSRVSGDFQTSLDYWHLARDVGTNPTLNSSFIECNPDTRIFAVTTGDNIYALINNKIYATRKLPKFGVPTI